VLLAAHQRSRDPGLHPNRERRVGLRGSRGEKAILLDAEHEPRPGRRNDFQALAGERAKPRARPLLRSEEVVQRRGKRRFQPYAGRDQ